MEKEIVKVKEKEEKENSSNSSYRISQDASKNQYLQQHQLVQLPEQQSGTATTVMGGDMSPKTHETTATLNPLVSDLWTVQEGGAFSHAGRE